MADVLENIQETTETTTPINPFSPEGWKTEPSIPIVATDPVIEEKDKEIKEEKPTSDKHDEPEKIPGASPKPIQDRPAEEKENGSAEPLKFANEESEKVFNLIKEGKIDDVYNIISEQKKLANADKLPPADIIKLNLQYQNKDFTPQEVQELFEDTYMMPEKPVQGSMEDDDEFKVKMDKYEAQVKRIESRISRDAKPASAELLKLSKEIVLPDIPQKQQNVNNEPTQEELDAMKKQTELFLQTVDTGLQTFQGYQTTFKDEEVDMKVGIKLTKEQKDELQPLLSLAHSNAPDFLKGIGWLDENGNLNAEKMMQDLPLILHKEDVLAKLVSEAATKRYAEAKKSIKNIDYNGNKGGGDIGQSNQQKEGALVTHFFSN